MLTAEGCRTRRGRLLDRLLPKEPLLLGDPLMLRYFAGLTIDPFSLGADYGALLKIEPTGETHLHYDARVPKSVEASHVDRRTPIVWYDGKSPGLGARRESLRSVVETNGGRVHDHWCNPLSARLWAMTDELRRAKDADEIETLKTCMRITEAGQAWARANVRAGMTELDVYNGIASVCNSAAGQAVIVYGDFSVSPGSTKRGGGPTSHVLKTGETLILDFSVVFAGYRSDFTNTLVVGGKPTAGQQELFDLSSAAMHAGERLLKPGTPCLEVYHSIHETFASAGKADAFPHHAGHGLGIAHPEAPFFVAKATETLVVGDVVTLEPGLYIDGIGGVRIEHNYLITPTGHETLSRHALSLS